MSDEMPLKSLLAGLERPIRPSADVAAEIEARVLASFDARTDEAGNDGGRADGEQIYEISVVVTEPASSRRRAYLPVMAACLVVVAAMWFLARPGMDPAINVVDQEVVEQVTQSLDRVCTTELAAFAEAFDTYRSRSDPGVRRGRDLPLIEARALLIDALFGATEQWPRPYRAPLDMLRTARAENDAARALVDDAPPLIDAHHGASQEALADFFRSSALPAVASCDPGVVAWRPNG